MMKFDRYLKKPCKKIHVDPLCLWEENTETYSRISKNAEKVLSILASSAAFEIVQVLLEKHIVQNDVVLVTLNLNNLCLLDRKLSNKKINSYSNSL